MGNFESLRETKLEIWGFYFIKKKPTPPTPKSESRFITTIIKVK